MNLIPLIDPIKDASVGTWIIEKGSLVSVGNKNAIQIPYVPPEEYDFRIVFSRTSGNENVTQIFSQRGRAADWVMDGWGQRIFGFERVAGKNADANNTTVHLPHGFDNGHSYTSILQVRKNGVQALLDGKVVSQWVTDFSDAAVHDILDLPNHEALGLSTRSPTAFSKIDVLERTGKGKALRAPATAGASPQPPSSTPARVPPGSSSPTAGTVKGKFYLAIDDAVKLYLNGNEVFHVDNPQTVESNEIEIKPGDHLVAQLTNVKAGREFILLFVSSDRQTMVSFPHTVFKILSDPVLKDFSHMEFGRLSKSSRVDLTKHTKPLPFKNHSEWIWGDADFTALGCELSREMFQPVIK